MPVVAAALDRDLKSDPISTGLALYCTSELGELGRVHGWGRLCRSEIERIGFGVEYLLKTRSVFVLG